MTNECDDVAYRAFCDNGDCLWSSPLADHDVALGYLERHTDDTHDGDPVGKVEQSHG